eukprot:21741-Chlamydomonas_euryale.AAC.1
MCAEVAAARGALATLSRLVTKAAADPVGGSQLAYVLAAGLPQLVDSAAALAWASGGGGGGGGGDGGGRAS